MATATTTPRAWAPWTTYAHRCAHPLVLERIALALRDDTQPGQPAPTTAALPVIRLRLHIIEHHLIEERWTLEPGLVRRLCVPPAFGAGEWLHWLLLEQGLATFEETVLWTAHTAGHPAIHAAIAGLARALGVTDGLPDRERGLVAIALENGGGGRENIVAQAILRRLVVARLLSQWLLAPVRAAAGEWAYVATLFGDTHLEWMAAAYRYARWDDAFFLETGALDAVYPLPHRVVCFEELPDLAPLLSIAGLTYEAARNKNRTTLLREVARLFLGKQINQICHLRHLFEAIEAGMALYPEIGELLRLALWCALLGNFPGAHARLGLAARLRVTLAFARNPLAAGTPSDTDDAALLVFVNRYRYISLFMLHELFVTTCERDLVYDRLFSDSGIKWTDYKALVRHATGEVRRALDADTDRASGDDLNGGFWAPMTWRALEDTKRSPIEQLHELCRTTTKKIRKGRAEQLIYKKMISVQHAVVGHHMARLYAQPEHAAWHRLRHTEPDTEAHARHLLDAAPPTLRDLFVENFARPYWARQGPAPPPLAPSPYAPTAWPEVVDDFVREHLLLEPVRTVLEHRRDVFLRVAAAAADETMEVGAALRQREVLPLRYLQVLQLTRAQALEVARWVHRYYAYDEPDNKYRALALTFGKVSLYAHMAVKLYFKLVTEFRAEQLIVRPIDEALRVQNVLRDRLALAPADASPPELGHSLFCARCARFTCPLRAAPFWIDAEHDAHLMEQAVNAAQEKAGRVLAVDDFITPPHNIGASKHLFDLRDGMRYCKRGTIPTLKRIKAHMQRARPVEGVPDEDAEGGAPDEIEFTARGEPRLRAPPVNPLAVVVSAPTSRPPADLTPKQRTHARTMRALARAAAPIMDSLRAESCERAPLVVANLVGLWYQRHRTIYGHCVYCADLVVVTAWKMTNYGLSCMNHPHAEFAVDSFAALAFAAIRAAPVSGGRAARARVIAEPVYRANKLLTRDAMQLEMQTTGGVARHPHLLDTPVPCAFCARYDTQFTIRVYDSMYRMYELPLCAVDLGVLRHQIPALQIGKAGAPAVEPMALYEAARELAMAHARRMPAPPLGDETL